MKITIEKGQVWASGNGTDFYVDDIRVEGTDVWIHYTNMFTHQTYSCLEPAFRQRFTIASNRS